MASKFIENIERRMSNQKKQYIMPTTSGYSFATVTFVLFLAGIIYGNNIVLSLAFLGVSFFIIEMFQTHFSLRNLQITTLTLKDGFSESNSPLKLLLKHSEFSKIKFSNTNKLNAVYENETSDNIEKNVTLNSTCQTRGLNILKKTKITLWGEFNLFYTWSYIQDEIRFYTYPKLIELNESNNFLNLNNGNDNSEFHTHNKIEHFSSSRIDWKLYSKTRELFEKKYQSPSDVELKLNYDLVPGDHEEKLSLLTSIIHEQGNSYKTIILNLPNGIFEETLENGYKTLYQNLATA